MNIFISAERLECSDMFNGYRTAYLRDRLRQFGYNYDVVQGCYKGTSETAFMVTDIKDGMLDTLKLLAKELGQESVMLTVANFAYLHYIEGFEEYIGVIKAVKSTEGLESYTITSNGVILTVGVSNE